MTKAFPSPERGVVAPASPAASGRSLQQVCVVGCGLLGGSLLKALRMSIPAIRLTAIDRPSILKDANSLLDDGAEAESPEAERLMGASDVVVLATPVSTIARLLPWTLDHLAADGVATDLGSVKGALTDVARAHPRRGSFVPGHPMAGREVGGFASASADLFRGAKWFLMDGEGSEWAASRIEQLIRAVGAEPVFVGAAEHDRAMSFVSHLPQLVATALYDLALRHSAVGYAGPGFRDTTRIAGGPRSVWADIFANNRESVLHALDELLGMLQGVRGEFAEASHPLDRTLALLEEAQQHRRGLPAFDNGLSSGTR